MPISFNLFQTLEKCPIVWLITIKNKTKAIKILKKNIVCVQRVNRCEKYYDWIAADSVRILQIITDLVGGILHMGNITDHTQCAR